jgi:hypothetical protein
MENASRSSIVEGREMETTSRTKTSAKLSARLLETMETMVRGTKATKGKVRGTKAT